MPIFSEIFQKKSSPIGVKFAAVQKNTGKTAEIAERNAASIFKGSGNFQIGAGEFKICVFVVEKIPVFSRNYNIRAASRNVIFIQQRFINQKI